MARTLPKWKISGRLNHDRCSVLLDEGVQLTRPVTFVGAPAGGWYIDLVRVEALAADQLAVDDLYVDFVVPHHVPVRGSGPG